MPYSVQRFQALPMSTPVAAARPRPPSPVPAPTRRVVRFALLAFAGAAFGAAAFAQSPLLSVLPARPQASQPTCVRIEPSGCRTFSAVRHVGGQFAIDVVGTVCEPPPPGRFRVDVSLGRLPPGEYRARACDGGAPDLPPLGPEIRFTIAAPGGGVPPGDYGPLVDFSSMWWNPERAGEGWFVDHGPPNRIAVLWTMHDADQQPVRLWMQGTRQFFASVSGRAYRFTGTPPVLASTIVGHGEFVGDGFPFARRYDPQSSGTRRSGGRCSASNGSACRHRGTARRGRGPCSRRVRAPDGSSTADGRDLTSSWFRDHRGAATLPSTARVGPRIRRWGRR